MGKQSWADVAVSESCCSLTTWDFVFPLGSQNIPAAWRLSLLAGLRHLINRRLRRTKRYLFAERAPVPLGELPPMLWVWFLLFSLPILQMWLKVQGEPPGRGAKR